jgi:hypothetical protein
MSVAPPERWGLERWPEPGEDEWVRPVERSYKMCCCDCGLVHSVDFRVVNGLVEFRMRRDDEATEAERHGSPTGARSNRTASASAQVPRA